MAFGLDDLLMAVAGTVLSNVLAPKPRIPRDALQDRLVAEQLSQLQAMRNLAPLLAAQQTLAGIAQGREAMERMLREAARRQGALGLVDSAALDEARGRALAAFGESVARLRQHQPFLLMELMQGAQEPLAALQQLAAQRQASAAQEAALQQEAQQAWGQMLGYVLPLLLRKPARQPAVKPLPPVNVSSWNPDVSLRLPSSPSLTERIRKELRW